MASLSHSPLPDYPNKRICKEATSSLYPSSNNNMQDLYAFMQTLHPQMQAPTYINAKPFYYSSNVQGMSKVNGEEELGSLSTNTSSTSWGNDQASLQQQKLMEAMESKALISTFNHVTEEHHVNAAKKRIRAIMDHKDAEKDDEGQGGMKRTKSTGSGEVIVQKKELPKEVKPTNSNAQKARGNTPNKHDNTEPKYSDVKSNGKASASPTSEPDSPSKPDFIHVRARRGQATDSHSLAERVRREKISERMKYLQDLVPGCVKVTGKAMMLDEIINYVQALQRQVEFLSMKLAAVHPSKLEFSLENLFGKKQVGQPNNVKDGNTLGSGAAVPAFAPSLDYQGDIGSGYAMRGNEMFCDSMRLHVVDASMLQTANQLPCNPAEFLANLHTDLGVDDDALMHRTVAENSSCSLTPTTTDTMIEPAYHSCISQNSQSELDWDDDLQNIVQQMGCFSQTSSLFPPHLLSEGLFLQSHMKTEL